MAYRYQSKLRQEWNEEGRQEGLREGRREGEAAAVLLVLGARGITVPEEIKQAVLACDDQGQLETLLTRAATVERAEDLFA